MTQTILPDSCRHPGHAPLDHLARVPVGQLLLGASGWLTLVAAQLPPGNPARIVAAFGFMLTCPGLAISRLVSRDTIERCALTVTLSMSLAILVSVAATVARNNSMTLQLVVLAAITSIAVLAGNIRIRGTRAAVLRRKAGVLAAITSRAVLAGNIRIRGARAAVLQRKAGARQ
jgi:hypothetical protein